MRLVLDWDGTVTERDTLYMAIERFGDLDVFRQLEARIGLVVDSALVEPAGKAVAREDPVCSERDAAVGDAVTDVDEGVAPGKRHALAGLATDLACLPVEEHRPPACGAWLQTVRDDRHDDTFTLEQRLDQLAEARRDDQRVVGRHELGEPRP